MGQWYQKIKNIGKRVEEVIVYESGALSQEGRGNKLEGFVNLSEIKEKGREHESRELEELYRVGW